MKIKNISKLLVLGLVFNNILNTSFANVKDLGTDIVDSGNPVIINKELQENDAYLELEGKTILNLLENVEWQARNSYLYNSNLMSDISNKVLTLINLSDKPLIMSLNSDGVEGFNGSFSREVIIPQNSSVVEKLSENEALRTFVAYQKDGWDLSADSKELMAKLIVLEGEYDENSIPKEYFEGMISVGELDNNIQLITQSKNLWDGELELGSLNNSNGGVAASVNNLRTKNFIEVEGGKTYTLSNDMSYSNYLYEYDKDKNFIKYDGVKLVSRTVTLNEKTRYVKFRSTMNEVQNDLNVKYLFELGDKQTSYVAPQKNVLDFTLTEPLRSIPGVAKDKILRKNGQWFIERNCGERDYNALTDLLNENVLTDKVKTIYELDSPIYEHLSDDSDVTLYEDITYVYTKSDILLNIRVLVDETLSLAIKYLEEAIANPTIENISNARLYISLLEDSSLKDQLQDQLNNIVEVKDLEIEKKTTSVNTDVYIKFKNTLSMSLNTNFITFENYSGVEDIEIQDALELSVSSSLPYDLNAYLETEIQNADKTKTLDKSALSIKESSSSDYKSFVNTSDKLVLKENCSDGNFVVHNIDVKLNGGIIHDRDVYKTTVKFEVEQK